MEDEGGDWVTLLQVKDTPKIASKPQEARRREHGTQNTGRSVEQILHHSLELEQTLPTPWSWTSRLQN